ncbi:MAG: NAD(FAD)-utilizing dehydrogenase [Bacillota bacterium]|nr:NAD(FAD)-utilizing dehydrogenase [Bacillota bacterium]
MRYRIHQIKLNTDANHEDFEKAIRKKIKRRDAKIWDVVIVKESIDARKKPDVKLVYTFDFSCDLKLPLDEAKATHYENIVKKNPDAGKRPVIAGFGPCGMFAGLILAEAGMKPIIIERGQSVDKRMAAVQAFWEGGKLDPESNVQFGEGGAGTFSDGKLTTGIKDSRISKVIEELVEAGAQEEIRYKQKPHIGTDKLVDIVKSIRQKIEALGGEVRFETRLENIVTEEIGSRKVLKAVETNCGTIETDDLVLAIGHSARDTFKMLYDNRLPMEQKPFSIGVRIEHPQEVINKAQYGEPVLAEVLGAADYKLNHRCENGRGVYTFCMCPGGHVINASSEENTAVTNGMSNSARDSEYANSGLLVDVRTDDFGSTHPLAGIEFQRKYERLAYEMGGGRLPSSTYGSFRDRDDDIVRKSLPGFASEAIIEAMPSLGRKLKGFDSDDAIMTAVETRSSSPVRIKRGEDFQTSVAGIYPAGEGPGYAGGIMSAAVDGIKVAEKIILKL